MRVSSILLEPFRIHHMRVDDKVKVDELLAMVGLSSEQPTNIRINSLAGRRGRVGIARRPGPQSGLIGGR